jgi:hypothetical protein
MHIVHRIQVEHIREFMVIRDDHAGQVILFDQFVV